MRIALDIVRNRMRRSARQCALGLLAAACSMAAASAAHAATFTYHGSGGALPDLVNFQSSITVSESFTLTDVNVTLNNLHHTYWADLDIYLTKGATSVRLTNNHGGSSDPNGSFTFNDEASLTLSNLNASGGTFKPLDALSAFDNLLSAGTWTLGIRDEYGQDAGSLGSWTLTLDTAAASAVPIPGALPLFASALGLGGLFGWKRKRKAVLA